MLPAGQAAACINLYPFAGRMEGWRQPKLLRALNNSAAQNVYRIPTTVGSYAVAYVVFTGTPANNDTLTIGEFTYRFVTTILNINDILIGASSQTAAFNCLAAVTTDAGLQTNMGTLYGPSTAGNPDVGFNTCGVTEVPLGAGSGSSQYIPCVIIQAAAEGVSANAVPISTTSASIAILGSPTSLTNTVTTLTGGINPAFNNSVTASSSWLEFLDPNTDVVRSQVLNDSFQRYYMASTSVRPKYNTAARIAAGQAAFDLGINPPLVASTVSASGGGNTLTLPAANLTNNGSYFSLVAKSINLIAFTPTADMQLSDIVINPESVDATCNFAAVCYADASSGTSPTVPGQLLGTGTIVTGVSTGLYAISTFSNPIALLDGSPYWIGIMTDSAIALYKNSIASSTTYVIDNTFTNGPPGVAPNGTANQSDAQMWGIFNTSDVLEARAYVYTWVSAYQEESAPSPFTLATGWSDGNWQISFPPAVPLDLGTRRNLAYTRIYRTVTASNGTTSYYWVADIPITQLTYQDNASDAAIALNITIPSVNYFPPPANLQGLTLMPNGLMAGFVGNQIWICQPYLPHAWPPGNVFNTDFPIVGLGFTNGALVACTEANPYVLSGANPSVMSITKCQPPAPCISRGSIMSTDLGVYYMTPKGLFQVTNLSQATNVTELWITQEKWSQLTPQGNAFCIPLAGCYYCHGANSAPPTPDGFMIELNTDNTSFTIWPQPGGHRVGFSQLNGPNGYLVTNVLIDPWTAISLYIQNGQVYYRDFTDPAPTMVPFSYTSKIYQQNNKKNFAAARVFFTVPVSTPAQNATPNTKPASDPSWQTLQSGQYGILLTYADLGFGSGMQLVGANEIRQSGGLLRLPSGFKAEEWQWQVLAQVPISNIQIATSIGELGNV